MTQLNGDSSESVTHDGPQTWDISGVTLFRTLGYVVGLPSFMVGTALFMLGFALTHALVLNVACVLYSLAFVSIGGRPVLLRVNPQNEKQALKIAALSLLCGAICYGLLLVVVGALGVPVI